MELEGERINPGSPSMPGTFLALENGRGHLSFREWAFKKSFIWFSPRLAFAGVKISSLVQTTCWIQVNNQAEPHAFEHLSGSLSFLFCLPPGGMQLSGRESRSPKKAWVIYDPNSLSLGTCVLVFFFLFQASDFGQVGLDLEAEFEKDLKEVFIFHEASENSFQAHSWSCSGWTKASQLQDPDNGTLAILRLPTTLGCYWLPSSLKSRLYIESSCPPPPFILFVFDSPQKNWIV